MRPVGRVQSASSDRPSIAGRSTLAPPPADVSPEPAYISASAASQWVAAELDDDEIEVSSEALRLLNSFLDQMLFSFLSSARSTRLPQLRLAVPDVLKPRLGKDAMASADEELREYLGEGDDEELSDFYDGHEPASDFDLDLAWKLARLRCMVYTRLGDIEEEDALEIIEREQLDERGGQHRRFSSRSSSITPAGAIFLTSIIEYLGEQALYHAGVLAENRLSGAHLHPHEDSADANNSSQPATGSRMVEEIDVRRLGREGPLARIWRNWRRPLRSPQDSLGRPFSPSMTSPSEYGGSRRGSATPVGAILYQNTAKTGQPSEPAQIPLPMSDNDVNEIEVPGLAREIDDGEPAEAEDGPPSSRLKRSSSMSFYSANPGQPSTPASLQTQMQLPQRSPQRPSFGRTRSRSLPTPPQSPLVVLHDTQAEHAMNVNGTELSMRGIEPAKDREDEDSVRADAGDQGHERSPKRNGVVMNVVPVLTGAMAAGSTQRDNDAREQSAPTSATRETVAERMLGSTRPTGDERAPPSAVTGAAIHKVTDFESIHVPERQPGFEAAMAITPIGETDPEDLALSSADEKPKTTESRLSQRRSTESRLSQRRSKHDSVPPIQVGSSSYTYSSQPGDNYIPTPIYSDFPMAPTHHKYVTVTPPQEAVPSNQTASRQAALRTLNKPDSPQKAQTAVSPQSTRPNPVKTQTPVVAEPSSSLGQAQNRESTRSSEYSERSSSSSKLLQFTRDEQGRPVPSSPSERGDLPRIMPPPTSRMVNGIQGMQSTSPSIPEEPRPTTAGSQFSAEKPTLRLRTSSDDSREAVRRTSFESEAKKKSLEILIQGDETLHYTLTPKTARASEVSGTTNPLGSGMHVANIAKFPEPMRRVLAPTQDSADYPKPAVSSNQEPTQHKKQKSVSSIKTDTGLRSSPLKEESRAEPSTTMPIPPAPVSRPATSKSATPSKFRSRVEPRDAKVDRNTSRDLADYLRSTGPENDQQLPRALNSRPGTSNTTATTTTRVGPQYPLPPRLGTSSGASVASGRSAMSRYAPRDAKVSKNATTSALADFIREGPPRAAGDHRIPRTVAPFRTTMDSDDLNGMAPSGDKDVAGRGSVASTYDNSVQSSTTSHTALLDGSRKAAMGQMNGSRPSASAARTPVQPASNDATPVRTQRRVRDPYAIDDSDEEIEEEIATPKPRRDEESLIDFLRNTAPQPNNAPPPVLALGSSSAVPSNQGIQKKASSSGIKERLTAMSGISRKTSQTALDTAPRPNSRLEHPPAYSRGSATRAESPHLSKVGSKLDSYKPTQPTHAPYVDRVRQSRSNGAVSSSEYTRTNQQSGLSQSTNVNAPKDENGFRAFFSRRKSVKK